MSQLTDANIDFIFDFIEELCGIALDHSKSYLIDARLANLVKQFQVKSPLELIERAKTNSGEPIRRALVEAMTTRETFFFRDNSPFDALQFKALPETLDVKSKARSNKLRIWSAAASTGQEACSIAMIILEMVPDISKWDIQILATDISEDALAKARSGIYSKLEVERGLPQNFVRKYLKPHPDGYKVSDAVTSLIRYQQLNLLKPFSFPYQFDIIFCRNVAIYFEKKVKIDLFRRMLPLLSRTGYLFVGVSESLFDCGPEFKPQAHCKGTFYQPNLAPQNQPALSTQSTPLPSPAPLRPSLNTPNSILPPNPLPTTPKVGSTIPAAQPSIPSPSAKPVGPLSPSSKSPTNNLSNPTAAPSVASSANTSKIPVVATLPAVGAFRPSMTAGSVSVSVSPTKTTPNKLS